MSQPQEKNERRSYIFSVMLVFALINGLIEIFFIGFTMIGYTLFPDRPVRIACLIILIANTVISVCFYLALIKMQEKLFESERINQMKYVNLLSKIHVLEAQAFGKTSTEQIEHKDHSDQEI